MCDLICDVINCCIEATIWAKSMYTYIDFAQILTEKPEKIECGNQINLYANLHLKDGLRWNSKLS